MFENKYICIYNFMEFTMIFTMQSKNNPRTKIYKKKTTPTKNLIILVLKRN